MATYADKFFWDCAVVGFPPALNWFDMRLIIAAVGKLKDGAERDLYDRYVGRLAGMSRQLALGPIELIEMPESRAAGAPERQADEAVRLKKAVAQAQTVVALTETGQNLSSVSFASLLRTRRDAGSSCLAFCIGGPDGHGPEILQRAELKLSLGSMTLPHGLARVVLAEQLYRAATIISGHPYHRA